MKFQDFSEWENPTNYTVTCNFWVGPEVSPTGYISYVWPPHSKKIVPAEFDQGIHQLDSQGVVVGGLAPQLRKIGAPYYLHPSLDVEAQRAKEAAIELEKQATLAAIAKTQLNAATRQRRV